VKSNKEIKIIIIYNWYELRVHKGKARLE